MRTLSLRSLVLLALSLALLGSSTLAAQGGQRDPKKAIAGFQRYLETKPYHDWAFDELVDNAISVNLLSDLVGEYEGRVEEEDALAPRIVLARLYARTDRIDQALEILNAVEDEDAALFRLVGALQLRAGRWSEAVTALDRAAESTDDEQLLEEIHKERGKAHLAAGDREAAAAAFRDLAKLDETSFHLGLEAASELAWHGLTEEALEEFARCEELAEGDTSKRCRVLSEIGRLHERLNQGEEAVTTYRKAIALMARGHWLKRDLFDRILAIHQRAGTVEELEGLAAEAAGDAADLDAREFHARVLVTASRLPEARDVLQAATEDFPADLTLSRSLLDALEALEDDEGRIAEYQRILAEKPDELELYLELGRLFASSGRFEQAKRQWNKTLEKRLDDAGLCVRLAGFYALFDQVDDAVGMYERAIELQPREVRQYSELAAMLLVRGRADDVPEVLERADAAVRADGGDASRLAEVASLWNEFGRPDRARAALEDALALAPGDGPILSRLADVLLREGNEERAIELLHQIVAEAEEAGLRKSAVDRILRIYRLGGRTQELAALEEAAIEADPEAVAPRLVLGRVHLQNREPDLAIATYEELIGLDAGNEDARKALARLYEERGEFDLALAQYEAIVQARPQARRTYLKEMARIHLARYDQERAFACYDEILRGAPDNPAAFREVAEAYDKLGLHDQRLECLQQAVRLKPDDARTRLDLADAWRTLGEFARAKEEIQEAARVAVEEGVRDEARLKFYVLLGETGELEGEITELRRRVEDNPYDVEAPLVLTDIYVRELEYELALEMLERLITFQPKEARLLSQRARLLRLMERHDEAIGNYETLLKLPDTDRFQITLDYAEAVIESGDVERAQKILSNVADTRRIAQLYRRHDLFDQAIEALEKGIAGSPRDDKLLLSLASVHEEVGDLEAAVATLEKLLALKGDSWRVLNKLIDLYHDRGRKEDALDVGRRLFSLLRIEEVVEEEEEDPKEKNKPSFDVFRRSSYRWFNANQQYQERVGQLQRVFREKGWLDEFVDIGIEELRLQPTNSVLYRPVMRELRNLGEREADARALVRRMRAAFEKTGRTPVGTTPRAWRKSLEGDEMLVYRGKSQIAEERIAELEEEIAGEAVTAKSYRELAHLHLVLQHDAEVLETLRAGCEAFPESIELHAGLALTLQGEKRYAEAVEVFPRVIELVAASDWTEREAERLEESFKQQKRDLLQGFPLQVQKRVNDEVLRRAFQVTNGPSMTISWTLGGEVSLDGARMRLARCLLKLERKDEAVEILRELEPANRELMRRWSELANLLYEEELYDEAAVLYERMLAIEAELDAQPVLGHLRNWTRYVDRAVPNYGRIKEKRGEILDAYHLLRTYGKTQEGELLLTTHEAFSEAERKYRGARTAAAEALAAVPAEDEPEVKPWREASIRLADVLQFEKKWGEALEIYEEVAERLDDDFPVREQVAALHMRAGRVDEAIAERYGIIEKKRELNRYVQHDLEPEGRVLAPTPPATGGGGYNSFGYYGYFGGGRGGRNNTGLYELKPDYMKIVQLHLDRDDAKEAADVLAKLAREDANTFRWMSWEILEVVQGYQLGKDALPILRLLHSYDPDDDETALEYSRALIQTKRLEEAQKILQRVVNRGNRRYYTTTQAIEELDRLEARLGLTSTETVEDLAAAVEEDPKNVRTRMKLARRLYRDRRFEEALAAGRAAKEIAPHQADVTQFVKDTLTVLGRVEELEERLLEELDEEKSAQKRFELAVRISEWKLERGAPPEEIDELFDRVVERRWGGSIQYAPSSFWLERGDLGRGRAVLEEEIEAMGPDSNASYQARKRLSELDLLEGQPDRAVEDIFERFEEATDHTSRLARFSELAGTLRAIPDREVTRDAVERLSTQWAEEFPARPVILRLAATLAAGDVLALEKDIDVLVQEDDGYLWLYPALVELARQRADRQAALDYLLRLEELGVASKSRRSGTSIGYVSETVALDAAIGSLLFELGRREEALARWAELFSEEDLDENRGVLATLYELHELRDLAAEQLEEWIEDQDGNEKLPTLRRLAELDVEAGDLDRAIERAETAEVLSGHGAQQRQFLVQLHRRRGTLAEYFAELVAEAEKDPNDDALAKLLVQLAIELERDEIAVATVERLVETKPDQAKALRPYLIRMKLVRGDEDGALDAYQKLLEGNVNEWEREQYGTQLARVLAKRGELDRAKEVLRRTYPDPEGYEAVLAIGEQLAEIERWEEALAEAELAITLDPRGAGAHGLAVRMELELERGRAALDRLYGLLEDPALYDALSVGPRAARRFDEELGESPRLLEAHRAQPGERGPARRLGTYLYWLGRREEAIAPLEAAFAVEPEDELVLESLASCYEEVGRHEDALVALERLVELLDRERGLERQGWSADSAIERQVNAIKRQHLLLGDEAAALRVDERRLGTRHRDLAAYYYNYSNSPFRRSWSTLSWLQSHGFFEEYARMQRFLAVFDRWNRRNYEHQAFEMRYRAGDRSVLEELWQSVLEPGRSLVGMSNNSYYYTTSRSSSISSTASLLIRLFEEEGRTEELVARIEDELSRHPEDPVMLPMLVRILSTEERWEEVLEHRRRELEEEPDDVQRKSRVATVLMRLERWEEALPLLEDVYRSYVSSVPTSSGQQRSYVRVGGGESKRGPLAKVDFAWSGSSRTGAQTISYFSTSGDTGLEVNDQEESARRNLMVTLSALGRGEEARKLEEISRSMSVIQRWGWKPILQILSAYREHGRLADCERVAEIALEADLEESDETFVYRAMCDLYREHGDDERRLAWAERWREALDEELADAALVAPILRRRAELFLEEFDDPGRALRDLEAIPTASPAVVRERIEVEGWVALAAGDPSRARDRFLEAERRGWIQGSPPDAALLYGQGFALAALGQAGESHPRLRRALVGDSTSKHAPRAEELLQ